MLRPVDGGRRAAVRAHRLVATALMLLGLAACNGSSDTEAELLARQQAIDPPTLWLVEALGADGEVRARVYVCADKALRETFLRTRAEINGEMCRDDSRPVVKPGLWAVRCEARGRRFAVSANTAGDPARDFRLDFALTPLDRQTGTVRQIRHFRSIGACPGGWRIGDQTRPAAAP